MQKTIHKTKDKKTARPRLTAMLMLHRGDTVNYVARTLCCALLSIRRWINWFTLSGVEGLKSLPSGQEVLSEYIRALLRELVKHSPGDFGYQRSRRRAGSGDIATSPVAQTLHHLAMVTAQSRADTAYP